MKRRTRNYAKRQLTWMRRLAGVHLIDLTDGRRRGAAGRDRAARARDRVPRRALREVAGARQRLRDRGRARAALRPHPGTGPALCAHRTPASAPTASLLRPRDRRARLRGRGCGSSTRTARRPSCRATACARPCSTCAATAGWTHDSFSIRTAAGEIRPRITARIPARSTWAAAQLRSERDFPSGGEDGAGTIEVRGARVRLPVRAGGQPAVRDRAGRGPGGARPGALRRRDRAPRAVPRRTNVSFWRAHRRRPDPRAHLRARGGGDDVLGHRRHGRRGGGGAARHATAR